MGAGAIDGGRGGRQPPTETPGLSTPHATEGPGTWHLEWSLQRVAPVFQRLFFLGALARLSASAVPKTQRQLWRQAVCVCLQL